MITFRQRLLATSTLAAAALMAGCASPVKLDEPAPVETRPTTPVAPANANGNTSGLGNGGVKSVDLGAGAAKADDSKLERVVYFDYDSNVVKDEFRPLLEAHAKRLKADGKKKVAVEGHTDERGGREYNLALGQRRAEAVVKSLGLLGVPEAQLEAVSFGKEKPAATGSDEAAWAKNRRAELADR